MYDFCTLTILYSDTLTNYHCMKQIVLSFALALCIVLLSAGVSSAQNDSTFKPSGKFSAQFFTDYYYKMAADSLGRGSGQYAKGVPKDFSNFEVRRVYFGYNYNISPDFSTEFLLAYEGNNDASGKRTVYVKLANIQWKDIFSNATLIFGAQATPSFSLLSEGVWGYRSVEKTLLDKNGIAGSNDVGLGLRGAFTDDKNYGYDIMYANGAGASPETDRYKRLYGDVWAKFMDKKIIINVYGDLERKSELPKDNHTLKFFAAYNTAPLTVGVEGVMQTLGSATYDSTTAALANQTKFGLSVFVTGQIIEKKLNFFARYDMFDPNTNYTENDLYTSGFLSSGTTTKENFIVAGIDWTPYTNVHIMPNFWYTGYSSKLANVSGKVASDADIVPRVTVFYKF
jgi:hypothetical protein